MKECFHFNLLDIKATKDLLDLFDLEDGMHYFSKKNPNGVRYFMVVLDSSETKMLYDCIKDFDFYSPQLGLYLSDYLFLKIQPHREMTMLLNRFSMEDLFDPYLHNPKILRLRKKYFK